MVKTPSEIKVNDGGEERTVTVALVNQPAPEASAQAPVERVGEINPFDHFQTFEQPEPVTFAKTYRYVGPGHIPGVPTEDLDASTVQRLSPELRREVAGSPLYEAEGGK